MMLGVLVFVSNATAVPWNNEPTGQTISTLTADTSVTFANPDHVSLPENGTYQVKETSTWFNAKRPSTGEVQRTNMIVREPIGAGKGLPAVVFMHGAGYGTAKNSFGDVAEAMASAGFVTAVIDKPAWSTNDVTRDYPGSAAVYDQVIDMLRGRNDVDAGKVGIYATSESTWVSAYLLRMDRKVAFQILLSPMVFSPREAVGFLAAQDFALAGAHEGYQSIVRRAFNADSAMFGVTNPDIRTLEPQTYSIPTLVAYGSKDVMTAQVEGTEAMLAMAHRAGNWDMTIRSYPVANHVLRLGDESTAGTGFADRYVSDVIDWAVGQTRGLKQTSERVAGIRLYQSITVPKDLHANRGLTVYGVLVHVFMLVMLLLALIVALVAFALRIHAAVRRRKGPLLGFSHGFGNQLLTLTITTMATLALFAAGLGQVVMAVVKIAWGGAPDDEPGLMVWSWPVIQVVCTLVVWAWSRVVARLIEVAMNRGVLQFPPRRGSIRAVVSGREPVLASTRLGRVLFWVTSIAMFSVLLVFAFWGLFIY
ncbi:alpha/beta hydrolase family protein [Bifidobacterium leontopitheci]|nr:alpha/beta hydrolase [Bifidobacterium leontopitheci]